LMVRWVCAHRAGSWLRGSCSRRRSVSQRPHRHRLERGCSTAILVRRCIAPREIRASSRRPVRHRRRAVVTCGIARKPGARPGRPHVRSGAGAHAATHDRSVASAPLARLVATNAMRTRATRPAPRARRSATRVRAEAQRAINRRIVDLGPRTSRGTPREHDGHAPIDPFMAVMLSPPASRREPPAR
jgi:hypothetical protein